MNISGTLHFYSGEDRELFFVFDDDLAQQLYRDPAFDPADLESRRAYISVGSSPFIHRRTLSFSRKQTEIKVSLCSRATKDGLGDLTALYDWFAARGRPRPTPLAVIGTFRQAKNKGRTVWELRITEPAGLVAPPGFRRRQKVGPRERRSYEHRRRLLQRDHIDAGRPAEELALALARRDFRSPGYHCLWRDDFLDSERLEVRKMGIIADIDVWNNRKQVPEVFIEVKSQKVTRRDSDPAFYLSVGEWRSFRSAARAQVPYQVWLFQYLRVPDFKNAPKQVQLTVFEELDADWMQPDGYLVAPVGSAGKRYRLRGSSDRPSAVRIQR